MAATSTALTTKVESGSPYQLSSVQTLKASHALLKHIKDSEVKLETKPNLLASTEDDDEEQADDSTPIWLTLTTKKHIIDKNKLKPSKLPVPHPLNTSTTATICLITADPQRTFKDIIWGPTFPSALGKRIIRVIGLSKLKTKFKQYEAQRKLFAEHDIFLADDRIVTQLVGVLGKTFYKTTVKRPIPVILAAPKAKSNGKRVARARNQTGEHVSLNAGTAEAISKEIEKAVQSAMVNLSPSTNTSVRVGYASWDAQKLAENVEAVANGLIEKFVAKKWRGVKGIHIKGPETASLPIWLADEMWVDEEDVVEEAFVEANVGKKRKANSAPEERVKKLDEKFKKQKVLKESNDESLDQEIALRKEKLRKQKAEAAKGLEDDVPKATTKTKKGKGKTTTSGVSL